MKKHLLLGSALLAVASAFPQAASNKKRLTPIENISVIMSQRFASSTRVETSDQTSVSGQVINQVEAPATAMRTSNTSSIAVNWNSFTGSMNMFGVLLPESKPLQYDDELNAVTFVHRKSATYVPSPVPTSVGAATGVLCAMVSQNWGGSWDSTMIYNDNNNWARYPQGGILKAANGSSPSNTNIANSYIVATAPITQANTALGWIGNIITTKALGPGTYNNIQAAASQTFIPNLAPFSGPSGSAWGTNIKVDFLREGFTSTDDGKIRALGPIYNGDINATPAPRYRGARIVTGSFNSGSMVFSSDSLFPPVRNNSLDGSALLAFPNGMAWSEDGLTGYVYFVGAHSAAVGSTVGANVGYQPIIARTLNAGVTWTWHSIDFNQPSFKAPVLDRLASTAGDTSLTVPFTNFWEGVSCVVDSAKNLHLVSLMVHSPIGDSPDSVGYTQKYINYDTERYYYAHEPGNRPYLYDFTGGANGTFSVTLIDSLSSEGPSGTLNGDGYPNNPWLADAVAPNGKIEIDARIQVSRTINGRYIVYSWAETDTTNTPTSDGGFTKWNYFPNIKARMMDVKTGSVSATEVNVSRLPDANGQTRMSKTSYNHYIAQKCSEDLAAATVNSVVIRVPHTITFNSSLNPLTPAIHRYASVPLEFKRLSVTTVTTTPSDTTGISNNNLSSVANSYIYPNPASNSAFLEIELQNSSSIKITIVNITGQAVKTFERKAEAGNNTIVIDLNGLSKGIYLVNINAENSTGTKKLVIE
jgi:hypothetical protein